MREVKFRAWDEDLKEMYELGKVNYLGSTGITDTYIGCDEAIWMQYTGLKDKNGVEIYEGDVGWDEHYECYGLVEFDEGKFVYNWDNICDDLIEVRDVIEICGNIYENPELLEVSE